jgi:hypothetical protein
LTRTLTTRASTGLATLPRASPVPSPLSPIGLHAPTSVCHRNTRWHPTVRVPASGGDPSPSAQTEGPGVRMYGGEPPHVRSSMHRMTITNQARRGARDHARDAGSIYDQQRDQQSITIFLLLHILLRRERGPWRVRVSVCGLVCRRAKRQNPNTAVIGILDAAPHTGPTATPHTKIENSGPAREPCPAGDR